MSESERREGDGKKPALAYIAGATGFVLTLGLIGFVGWQAVIGPDAPAPSVTVATRQIRPASAGYVVEIEARNTTSVTAAAVQIEAELDIPGSDPMTSNLTLDYVPGHSTRKAGVYFPVNPARGTLKIRALGYAAP